MQRNDNVCIFVCSPIHTRSIDINWGNVWLGLHNKSILIVETWYCMQILINLSSIPLHNALLSNAFCGRKFLAQKPYKSRAYLGIPSGARVRKLGLWLLSLGFTLDPLLIGYLSFFKYRSKYYEILCHVWNHERLIHPQLILGWPSTKEISLASISKEFFWLVSSTKLPFFEYVGPKPLKLSHQYLKWPFGMWW